MDIQIKTENTPILILAGGMASRLGTISNSTPKAMVPIDGTPFISLQLKLLKKKGFHRVVIATGYMGDKIKSFLKNGSEFGLEIQYSDDGESLLGTGGATKNALCLLDEQFFVTYGDTLLPNSFAPLIENFNGIACMMVYENENKLDKSNAAFDGSNLIYRKKKPDAHATFIDYGISLIKSRCFDPYKGQFDLATVFENLSAEKKLAGAIATERFFEIGTPASLAELRQLKIIE